MKKSTTSAISLTVNQERNCSAQRRHYIACPVSYTKMVLLPFLLLVIGHSALGAKRTVDNSCPLDLLGRVSSVYFKVSGDYCYWFRTHENVLYDDATSRCASHKGELAMPKTKAVNDLFITTLTDTLQHEDPVWIGMHDRKGEKKYEWEDGTKPTWTDFSSDTGHWFYGDFEDCIALDPSDGKWHDYRCGNQGLFDFFLGPKGFVCQFPARDLEDGDDVDNEATDDDNTLDKEDGCVFICNVDCFPQGYKVNATDGCSICECNEDIPAGDGTTISTGQGEEEKKEDTCPPFENCTIDCFPNIYKLDDNNCQICECDE